MTRARDLTQQSHGIWPGPRGESWSKMKMLIIFFFFFFASWRRLGCPSGKWFLRCVLMQALHLCSFVPPSLSLSFSSSSAIWYSTEEVRFEMERFRVRNPVREVTCPPSHSRVLGIRMVGSASTGFKFWWVQSSGFGVCWCHSSGFKF